METEGKEKILAATLKRKNVQEKEMIMWSKRGNKGNGEQQ